jgi:hypothetical protein
VKRAMVFLAACASHAPAKPPPEILGISVGKTSLADARAAVEAAGYPCKDASLAAMMPGLPAAPRLSCAGVPFGDAPGRLLLIGDDGGPVTALALQRTESDRARANAFAQTLFDDLGKQLGAPASRGDLPLARFTPVQRTWHAAGATVTVTATDVGATGVELSELIAR